VLIPSVSTSTLALAVSMLALAVSTLAALAGFVAWRRRRLAVSLSWIQFSLEDLHKAVNQYDNQGRGGIHGSPGKKARNKIEEKLPLVLDRKLRKALRKLLATCELADRDDPRGIGIFDEQIKRQLRYARNRTFKLRRRSAGS
jgi:hypothetical protein